MPYPTAGNGAGEALPSTIAGVVDLAREQISVLAGVDKDVVKLDLKIAY